MKEYGEETIKSAKGITCDCCGRKASLGDTDFELEEFVSIDFVGGYKSTFGDGSRVSLDICQYCLQDKLGKWLRILPSQ